MVRPNTRRSYKISPFSLDISRLDTPYKIKTKGIFEGLPSVVVTIKVLIFMLLFMLVIPYFAIVQGPVGQFGWIGGGILFIGWEFFWVLMLLPQKNGQYGYTWVFGVLKYYLNYKSQKVDTRGGADLLAVRELIGIENIEPDGRIKFTNGWVGRVYEVQGFASRLAAVEKLHDVTSSFENFLRTSPPNVSMSYPTDFTPIKLTEQRNFYRERAERLATPDLKAIASFSDNFHGNVLEAMYNVITQWMLISSDKEHTLNERCLIFQEKVQHDGLLKSAKPLISEEEVVKMLLSIYNG